MKYGDKKSYNIGDAVVYVNWLTSKYGQRMPHVMRVSSINTDGSCNGSYLGTVANGNQGGIDSMAISDMKPATKKQILDYAKAKANDIAKNWQYKPMGSTIEPTESLAQEEIDELVKEVQVYEPTFTGLPLSKRISKKSFDKSANDFLEFFKAVTNTTESDLCIQNIRKMIENGG